ncbi:MAG: PQQ-dependent sugar dehydrogenase [Bacteroidota bacterium]
MKSLTVNLFLTCILFLITVNVKAQLPDDFYDQVFTTGFDFPTGITFDENGRMYVWEKKGLVHLIDSSGQRYPQPLIDITEEVANWKDHGLMGFALDPAFQFNGYFYLLYAVDLHHYYNFGTSSYNPDTTVINTSTFGRVVRYQADPSNEYSTTLMDSKKILLGETIDSGIPLMYEFHGLGSLVVGQDGTLLVSVGDGTSNAGTDIGGDEFGTFASQAIEAGIMTEDEDIGSYRSQYLHNYNGKILRIDPNTGEGLPSNPFYQADDPNAPISKIWALGFRNPYRIALDPNTGSHYPDDGDPGVILAGDVGNGAWEELNLVDRGGKNFGWPIFEGNKGMWAFYINDVPFNQGAPNPLYPNGCDQPYFTFRDLLKAPKKDEELFFTNPCNSIETIPQEAYPMEAQFPIISWSNAKWNPPSRAMLPAFNDAGEIDNFEIGSDKVEATGETFDGYSSLSGIFYTADAFPEEYRGKFFGIDFSGWIKVFEFDEEYHLQSVTPFHDNSRDIIHLALNPKDGALYYINLGPHVRKISYGGNPAPVAVIDADKFYGPTPLTVQFDASNSYDINSDELTYQWDFGNGERSTSAVPSSTYSTNGNEIKSFPVSLTVTDSLGASSTSTQIVSVNNSPPQVNITSFEDGDKYPIDATSLLSLKADITDNEHSADQLFYQWKVYLHHNDHFHPEPTDFNPETHALISPLGCGEEIYYFRIELSVTDPEGLTTLDSRNIYPDCGEAFAELTPLEAISTENSIQLSWTSIQENDLAVYELQRSSDFYNFTTIATVDAKGIASDYTYQDRSPINGSNIYRLKMISQERAFNFSNLATASFPPLTDINLFPNPASNLLNIKVEESQTNLIQLELFDVKGSRVLATNYAAVIGEQFEKQIVVANLPRGNYFYRIINGDGSKVGKIILVP